MSERERPDLPRIGVTPGDAAGVGPEVVGAALAGLPEDVEAVLFATEPVRAAIVRACHAAGGDERRLQFVALPAAGEPAIPGQSSPNSRLDAYHALDALADAASTGTIDAMLTGPVPKAVFAHLPAPPPGQTEFLAGRLAAPRHAMMLAGPRLRVVPVTTHVPLREVASRLSVEAIVDATLAASVELRCVYGIAAPRIGVCGLNPHAGEGGRIGDEEARVVAPAVAVLQRAGLDVRGPLPADTAFRDGYHGGLDLVVAMYHDQALGPLKTVHFAEAVNFTCGLPVPRLSPDHGTAYDIAGKGVAEADSTALALRLACAAARARGPRRAALAALLALGLLLGCRESGPPATGALATPQPAATTAPTPTVTAQAPVAAAPAAATVAAASAAAPAASPGDADALPAGMLAPSSRSEVALGATPLLRIGPDAVVASGRRLLGLRCRHAAADCADATSPPADARLYAELDDRRDAGGGVIILPAVARWARGAGALTVAVVPDRRLSLRTLHEVFQTLRTVGCIPVLAARGTVEAGDGWVLHYPDADAPETLPEVAAGAAAVPADVHALLVEVDRDGNSVAMLRDGGGLMRRPTRDLGALRTRLDGIWAARPDLGAVTLDVGDGATVSQLYAAVQAVRDPCTRDEAGTCVAPRRAGHAASWVLRGDAAWSDGADDPIRAGTPAPLPAPPELQRARANLEKPASPRADPVQPADFRPRDMHTLQPLDLRARIAPRAPVPGARP